MGTVIKVRYLDASKLGGELAVRLRTGHFDGREWPPLPAKKWCNILGSVQHFVAPPLKKGKNSPETEEYG